LAILLLTPLWAVEATTVEFEAAEFTQQVKSSSAQRLLLDWPLILRLYAGVDGAAIWHDGNRLNERGKLLLSRIEQSEADGLNPEDYHLSRLQTLQALELADARVLRELLLSDGYLRLAVRLRQGNQAARTLDPFWKSQAESFDPVAALQSAVEQGQVAELLAGITPQSHAYGRLRLALSEYLQIERAGGWQRLSLEQSLRPDERGPWVVRLRDRLAVEAGSVLPPVSDPERYDADLVAAVEHFQTRHGLVADGVVGPATLEALNVPVSQRIAQLRANLERWRWLPHELETDHILVNTAGFDITLRSGDRVVFSGRTVNGRVERQTPPIISRITHLVANPQWTLPRRIAVEDMLPKLQEDPEFLARKRIRVYQQIVGEQLEIDPLGVDWSLYHEDNFPFILRQDAGPGNSLGRVKFHLPNQHAIFLHDTPARGLFNRSQRALSSGCVRVEGADQLASLLVSRASPVDVGRYSQAMDSGETLWVPLENPVPVYLTYFTSWVDAAGEVHFRPDIYHRDADLMLALGGVKHPVTAQNPAERPSVQL
jgi:murein L,D-transpeptidase YcbB/YkuD